MTDEPRALFRTVAFAEAVTWALLLTGMVLKHVTHTTDLGVQVGGLLHGVVFLAYVVVTLLVSIDARWSASRTVMALLAAIPPFLTVVFDLWLERHQPLSARWRLRRELAAKSYERLAMWVIRNPLPGLAVGLAAVAGLTVAALVIGPPGA